MRAIWSTWCCGRRLSRLLHRTGRTGAEIFYERYLQYRRTALIELIAAGQQDGSIGATGAPDDLYDAIYGSLFYRYVFGIKPISAAQSRNLVDTLLIIRSR